MEKHQIQQLLAALRSTDQCEQERGLLCAASCLDPGDRSEDLCLALGPS